MFLRESKYSKQTIHLLGTSILITLIQLLFIKVTFCWHVLFHLADILRGRKLYHYNIIWQIFWKGKKLYCEFPIFQINPFVKSLYIPYSFEKCTGISEIQNDIMIHNRYNIHTIILRRQAIKMLVNQALRGKGAWDRGGKKYMIIIKLISI